MSDFYIKDYRMKGICLGCGKPTSKGNHERCGDKSVSDKKKRQHRKAAKKYQNGKLPDWMYS